MSIYKDKNYSVDERVSDLISQMTLSEKVGQLKANMPNNLVDFDGTVNYEKLKNAVDVGLGRIVQFTMMPGISSVKLAKIYNELQKYFIENTRLGIPFLTQVECMTGLVLSDATDFPSPLSLGACFDEELVHEVGKVISDEMKAVGCRLGLAPVVDISRETRWGRNYENFGEDVFLTSRYGVEMVKGMQGEDVKDNVASCAKHFLAFSAPLAGKNTACVEIGEKELIETHATPYEAMIQEANLQGLMCTYSAINGEPMSISRKYLTGLLRDRLNFQGTAVCDGGSIERVFERQKAVKSYKEAGIEAVKAGLCSDAPKTNSYHFLTQAVENGELEEKYIDEQVRLVLKQKFELGLFDNPYIDESKVEEVYKNSENDKLNKKICDESLILLKNNGILPLQKGKKIAVIGPFSNKLRHLMSGYTYTSSLEMILGMVQGNMGSMMGVTDNAESKKPAGGFDLSKISPFLIKLASGAFTGTDTVEEIIKEQYNEPTIFEALKSIYDGEVCFEEGCDFVNITDEQISKAVELAKNSDIVIFTGGEKNGWAVGSTSGEGKDSTTTEMPESIKKLFFAVNDSNKNIILTLVNGRQLSLPIEMQECAAIIEMWLPGAKGGMSLADTIVGNNNPSGKLTLSIPRDAGQSPIFYNHKNGDSYTHGRSNEGLEAMFGGEYVNISSTPLYFFGEGLSYTNFVYSNMKIDKKEYKASEKIKLKFDLENTGEVQGKEICQVYLSLYGTKCVRPVKQLVSYKKVDLKKGEKVTLETEIDLSKVAYLNDEMQYILNDCQVVISVGTSSNNCDLTSEFNITGGEYHFKKRDFSNDFIITNI